MSGDGYDDEYGPVDLARKAEHSRRVMADYLRSGREIGALWFGVEVPTCDDETLSLRAAGVRNLPDVAYGIWDDDGNLRGIMYANGRTIMCAHGLDERFVLKPGEWRPVN